MSLYDDIFGTAATDSTSVPATSATVAGDTSTYFINPGATTSGVLGATGLSATNAAFFGTNTIGSTTNSGTISTSNLGTNLDLSAGSSGTPLITPTGNSLLDGISKTTATGVSSSSSALGTFGSYLETGAVATLAKLFGIQGTLPAAANSTVPLATATAAQAAQTQTLLMMGAALVAAYLLLKKA